MCLLDSSLVAANLRNGSIKLWDTEKGEIKYIFPCIRMSTLYHIKLLLNGEVIAVVYSNGCIILRNMREEPQEQIIPGLPLNNMGDTIGIFFTK